MLVINLHQPPQHAAVLYNQLSQGLHCMTAEEGGCCICDAMHVDKKEKAQSDQFSEHEQTETEHWV